MLMGSVLYSATKKHTFCVKAPVNNEQMRPEEQTRSPRLNMSDLGIDQEQDSGGNRQAPDDPQAEAQ